MFFTPNLVVGLTIMAVGVVLLLDTLGIREVGSFMRYWPFLIVLFGASLVAQAFKPVDPAAPKRQQGGVPCFFLFLLGVAMFWTFGLPGVIDTQASGRRATATGIMGRAETNVPGDVRNGRVAAVMGRSMLDLRQVNLAPGETMTVDVFVTMGRAQVRIPGHWVVDASALPVMGSVDEDRFTSLTDEITAELEAGDNDPNTETEAKDDKNGRRDVSSVGPPAPADVKPAQPPVAGPAPRLRLRGFVMMGKVEVTS
ncbi:MAG TPA: DUF5668 domain-containing protein [Vicinamibacterales bacterium]|nr:DUF5668 domain-containing protein [Vicinamibacterales bacterium]